MKPRLNKLITLLLLLGTFAFLMEAEERVSEIARQELSKWASLLPDEENEPQVQTLNPYAQKVSIKKAILSSFEEKDSTVIN